MKVSAKEKRIQKEPNGMLKLKNTKTKVKNSLSGLKNRINRTEEIITECENKQILSGQREKTDWKCPHCLPLPSIPASAKLLFCLHIAIRHITDTTFSNFVPWIFFIPK